MLEQEPGPIFSFSNKDVGEEARLNVVSVDDANWILNVLAAGGLIGKCVMSGGKKTASLWGQTAGKKTCIVQGPGSLSFIVNEAL